MAPLELLEPQALLAQQVQTEPMVLKAHKVSKEFRVYKVPKEYKVYKVLLGTNTRRPPLLLSPLVMSEIPLL
jgi:hypothetical protein